MTSNDLKKKGGCHITVVILPAGCVCHLQSLVTSVWTVCDRHLMPWIRSTITVLWSFVQSPRDRLHHLWEWREEGGENVWRGRRTRGEKKRGRCEYIHGNGLLDAGEKDNCLEYSFQVPVQFQALHLSEWVWVCVSVFQYVRVCVTSGFGVSSVTGVIACT